MPVLIKEMSGVVKLYKNTKNSTNDRIHIKTIYNQCFCFRYLHNYNLIFLNLFLSKYFAIVKGMESLLDHV